MLNVEFLIFNFPRWVKQSVKRKIRKSLPNAAAKRNIPANPVVLKRRKRSIFVNRKKSDLP
jgi:hypothetical protein